MREVAALAGVGTKTVSRVVNGEPLVSESTSQRVWAAVRKLDYHVDLRAGSLRRPGGATHTIALLVSSVANPFAGEVHRGVEDVARERDVAVIASSLDEDPEREARAIRDSMRRHVDGIIVDTVSSESSDEGVLGSILDLGVPIVFVDRAPQGVEADCVTSDTREAAARAGRRDGLVDAILMDLGVSSLQLDRTGRGFSYARRAPLDMRMDQSAGRTAQDILDTADERELARILRDYGEERFAARIAAGIVRRRESADPVASTDALVEVVRACVPAAARRSGGNPAKRTFQALRVAVNAELEVLERAVPRALNSIRVGGRIVIESYQSLEDRIVKRALAAGVSSTAPEGLPVVPPDAEPYLKSATRGALRADDVERAANPRSASVRLRAATRVRPADQAPAPELAPRPRTHPATMTARGRRGR